ncbi:hypothetical protein DRW41_17305 [Neobacillus piezotolerans]|uniref:Uncharacterized protein n=1 Tax=Neobacillus piezotolerans TaxID=2259171 RepID=A0A3D8GMH0_9BACI|nr:hypothetical protein DRW41_17305 [Neobacillus piezotolerans]
MLEWLWMLHCREQCLVIYTKMVVEGYGKRESLFITRRNFRNWPSFGKISRLSLVFMESVCYTTFYTK